MHSSKEKKNWALIQHAATSGLRTVWWVHDSCRHKILHECNDSAIQATSSVML